MKANTQEEPRIASPNCHWSIQVNRSKRVKKGTRCFRPADYFIPYAVHRPRAMTPIQQTREHPPSVLAPAGARIFPPHSFIVGGIALLVAIQLISLGLLSLQKKRYFEELYYLNTITHKDLRPKNDP